MSTENITRCFVATAVSIVIAVAALLSRSTADETSALPSADPGGGFAPFGVHLSLGTDDDEMVVMWQTLSPAATTVAYGKDSTLSMRATGYDKSFVDGGPERMVRYIHVVVLRGLEAGVKYYYEVGDPGIQPGGVSGRFFFHAKRSPSQIALSGRPLKILAFGDVGHRKSSDVLALIEKEIHGSGGGGGDGGGVVAMPDMLVHCGDLAYDLDTSNGRNGDAFLRDIEPIAAYIPYMISAGNHERAYNFSHYANRFLMPGHGRRTDNHYYSLDIGPLHLVAYNGEAFFWPEYFDVHYLSRMYDWLEEDLREANRNRAKTPWIVVHGHRPMYCALADAPDWPRPDQKGKTLPPELRGRCGWEKEAARRGVPSECSAAFGLDCFPRSESEVAASYHHVSHTSALSSSSSSFSQARVPPPRTAFPVEKLFYDNGVDLAFFGHVHDYERFFPVYDEVVRNGTSVTIDAYHEPAATVHVTTGSGGNPEMINIGTLPPARGPCLREAPWCAYQSGFAPRGGRTADFTYSRITVHNDSTLEWEQMSALEAGAVIDRFFVETSKHGSFSGRFDVAS